MSTEVDEDGAFRLITSVAQLVMSFCVSDKTRQTVCVRCARAFSDLARGFGQRSAVTVPDMPSVGVPGSERPTDPAGLVNYEPVLKKDQR